ncbi:helix-turn-helix domain-containing protein [Pseudomonas chlororaphis subsp. piscium]|nr:helix-turn-helix domain-containing protein [Pseudomonas chlororaphis subsp. piscium]
MNAIYKGLVDYFGTQEATAEKLKVDQSTVSGWVRGKHGMSPVIAKRAEALTEGAFKKNPYVRRFLGPKWPPDQALADSMNK